MKQQSMNTLVSWIRICITGLILCIFSLVLFSFVATKRMGDEIWKQLGLNKQTGTEGIYRSFTGGYLYYYDARNAKNIASGNRLAIAKDLLDYTRQYVNSDAFKKEYEQERKNAMPEAPVAKTMRTKKEIQQEEIAKTEKSIRDMEKSMKEFDADMRKNMQPVLDMFKKTLKEYQDPNHQYFEALVMNQQYEKEGDIRSYEERLKRWKENYPSDFTPVLKLRLQKFLDLTKDVDFNAELKTVHSLKKFVNPAYERKPTEWKQAYRAGKDVTEYARSFAEKWMAAL